MRDSCVTPAAEEPAEVPRWRVTRRGLWASGPWGRAMEQGPGRETGGGGQGGPEGSVVALGLGFRGVWEAKRAEGQRGRMAGPHAQGPPFSPGQGRQDPHPGMVSVRSSRYNRNTTDWGLINNRHLFLTVLEAGFGVWRRPTSWFIDAICFPGPHPADGAKGLCGVPFRRARVPFLRAPPSRPCPLAKAPPHAIPAGLGCGDTQSVYGNGS